MPRYLKKLGFIFLLFSIPLGLRAADFDISNYNPAQGDVILIYFNNSKPQSVVFDGQSFPVFRYKNNEVALIPIAATRKAGNYPLKIVFNDNNVLEKQIRVKARKFPKVVLGIPEELQMTPQTLVLNLQTQNKGLRDIFSVTSEDVSFNKPFGLPLADNRKLGSRFGEIRKTGSEEIRHLGVDLDGRLGASVYAINQGVVRRVYTDPVYGNSIVLDHGHGIFSGYFHLDKMKVGEGEAVKKGDAIATVGKTGYATAPHLHLSIKVDGVSVDPLRFVSIFK